MHLTHLLRRCRLLPLLTAGGFVFSTHLAGPAPPPPPHVTRRLPPPRLRLSARGTRPAPPSPGAAGTPAREAGGETRESQVARGGTLVWALGSHTELVQEKERAAGETHRTAGSTRAGGGAGVREGHVARAWSAGSRCPTELLVTPAVSIHPWGVTDRERQSFIMSVIS